MTATFVIRGAFPGLNEYTEECRRHRKAGARMKERQTARAALAASSMPRFRKPVTILFQWVERDRRRDHDNVAFAKKFILDGLKGAGVIEDDKPRFFLGYTDVFLYDRDRPRVVVTVTDDDRYAGRAR